MHQSPQRTTCVKALYGNKNKRRRAIPYTPQIAIAMQTSRQRIFYILADLLSASLAWFAFNLVRYFTLPINYGLTFEKYFSMPVVLLGQLLFPSMMVILYAISGYYNTVFFKSRLSDALNAFGISLIGSIIIFFAALFNDTINDRLGNVELLLVLWLFFGLIVTAGRLVVTTHTTALIKKGKIVFDCIIVGDTLQTVQLAKDLETKYPHMGYRVAAIASDSPSVLASSPYRTISTNDIEAESQASNISAFIVVPDNQADNVRDTILLINKLLPLGKSIYLTPNDYQLVAARPRTSMVAGHVLIDVSSANVPDSTANLKRIGDILLSSLALLLLLPLFLVLAVLIKRDSKGPVFYSQERIGYKKKPFKIYKFRSMRTDAEKDGPHLSSPNDSRITPMGTVLRKYRLDELPQFWNVLKGDMSLVGPRPERAYYLKQILDKAPYFNIIHQVRPGITSWAMVKYGYATSVEQMVERMRYDLIYVENVSLVVDLKILFYTVRTVLTGKGI